MYEAKTTSVAAFVDDPNLRLPRFQRKRTWKEKKMFNLAVTLYRGYPPGLVVAKRDVDSGGRTAMYLLDGRQRWESFKDMRDPELLWVWAKGALGLKNKDSEEEVHRKFLRYLDQYFGKEDWEEAQAEELGVVEEEGDETRQAEMALEEEPDEDTVPTMLESSESPEPDTEESADSEAGLLGADIGPLGGLLQLAELLLLVHPVTKRRDGGRTSPFSKAFHFADMVSGLDYMKRDTASGKWVVSTPRLIGWITTRKNIAALEKAPYPPSKEQFIAWLLEGGQLIGGASEGTLGEAIALRWPKIEAGFRLLDGMQDRMASTDISYVVITESTPNDEKKIFEIINTEGTHLTAAEILSAKPSWDAYVPEPDPSVHEDAKALFAQMEIPFDDRIRRWDVAATLLDRLKAELAFGGLEE